MIHRLPTWLLRFTLRSLSPLYSIILVLAWRVSFELDHREGNGGTLANGSAYTYHFTAKDANGHVLPLQEDAPTDYVPTTRA